MKHWTVDTNLLNQPVNFGAKNTRHIISRNRGYCVGIFYIPAQYLYLYVVLTTKELRCVTNHKSYIDDAYR